MEQLQLVGREQLAVPSANYLLENYKLLLKQCAKDVENIDKSESGRRITDDLSTWMKKSRNMIENAREKAENMEQQILVQIKEQNDEIESIKAEIRNIEVEIKSNDVELERLQETVGKIDDQLTKTKIAARDHKVGHDVLTGVGSSIAGVLGVAGLFFPPLLIGAAAAGVATGVGATDLMKTALKLESQACELKEQIQKLQDKISDENRTKSDFEDKMKEKEKRKDELNEDVKKLDRLLAHASTAKSILDQLEVNITPLILQADLLFRDQYDGNNRHLMKRWNNVFSTNRSAFDEEMRKAFEHYEDICQKYRN